jgi:hypothetical protein
VTYNRPPEDFKKQLSQFIADLKEGARVTSRNNKAQIDSYGRALARNKGISGERTSPQSMKTAVPAKKAAKAKKSKPARKQQRRLAHLAYSSELATALETLRSHKLESLYNSICNVRIEHTPLLTVGVWSFVESLCALAGKGENVDFVGYYSNQKLADLGFKEKTTLRDALTRIQRNGNSTKHHETAASFDGPQLSNDLETIVPLLIKTLETIRPKK